MAGRTNRVSLGSLVRDGFGEIVIGQDNPVYRDVTLVGTPGVQSGISIKVADCFTGELTLENASLSGGGETGCPAIDIGQDATIKLILKGENTLENGGIRVPSFSMLEIEGTGSLEIDLDDEEFYGIGNSLGESNGSITFAQSGEIKIDAIGKKGVCIGSGLGGSMELRDGKFTFEVSSDMSVCIGSIGGEVNLDIHDCKVNANMIGIKGACIGSIEGKTTKIVSENAELSGQIEVGEFVFIGSMAGENVKADIWGIRSEVTIRSDVATFAGAIKGSGDMRFDSIRADIHIYGSHARFLGGEKDNWADLVGSDVTLDIETKLDKEDVFSKEVMDIVNTKFSVKMNGKETEL
ncbi:MAG: hypothetical protein J5819_07800 [Eubacterium sp.]|nr:hypothetical protein [Eubacterium sp.]